MNRTRIATALIFMMAAGTVIADELIPFELVSFGRYDLASGTYTMGDREFGPATAWDATDPFGSFFGSAVGDEEVDWGDVAIGTVVNGFQIGYATDSPTPVDFVINFYEPGNGFLDASATLASFPVTGLPGSAGGGFEGFVFDVDLEGGGEFTISGPDIDADGLADFEYGYELVAAGGTATGPSIVIPGALSTGAEDAWDSYTGGSQNGGGAGGTFFFGGDPFAQFHMRLYTVPEPLSAVLISLGGLALLAIGRRRT